MACGEDRSRGLPGGWLGCLLGPGLLVGGPHGVSLAAGIRRVPATAGCVVRGSCARATQARAFRPDTGAGTPAWSAPPPPDSCRFLPGELTVKGLPGAKRRDAARRVARGNLTPVLRQNGA